MGRSSFKLHQRVFLSTATALLSVAAAERASAQSADIAVAESLFREGKQRMAAKDYDRACPRLADSHRLDPATGTLLALAICHERAGKLASAWAEYSEAAARARREHRQDREKAAREKVAVLEPKLSFLTIAPSSAVTQIPGIEITRNGVSVGPGTLGTPVPVDGGTYSIGASAPGKKAWRASVTIAPGGEKHAVSIPSLEDDTASAASAAAKTLAQPKPEPVSSSAAKSSEAVVALGERPQADSAKGGSSYGAVAAATIAAGVAGIGVGTVFLLRAIAKNEDSKGGCDGDRCSPVATQDRLDARSFGNAATIGFLAGGALLAAGTTLYLVGSPSKSSSARASATLEATPLIAPGALGGVLGGTF